MHYHNGLNQHMELSASQGAESRKEEERVRERGREEEKEGGRQEMRHDQNVPVLSVRQERLWRTDMKRGTQEEADSNYFMLSNLLS